MGERRKGEEERGERRKRVGERRAKEKMRRIELKGLSNNFNDFIRVLKVDAEKLQPTATVKVNSDLLFVPDLQTKSISQIAVGRKITARGYELFGTLLCSISIAEMSGCFGLTYKMHQTTWNCNHWK